jgi:hypothetical protein
MGTDIHLLLVTPCANASCGVTKSRRRRDRSCRFLLTGAARASLLHVDDVAKVAYDPVKWRQRSGAATIETWRA